MPGRMKALSSWKSTFIWHRQGVFQKRYSNGRGCAGSPLGAYSFGMAQLTQSYTHGASDIIALTVGSQESQEALKTCLAKHGATHASVAATNVYLADIADFARMNAIYASMFTGAFPTRTTIQSVPPAKAQFAVRLSAIAEMP